MKILRYNDSNGTIHRAAQVEDRWIRLASDNFGESQISDDEAQIARVLAPLAPVCIYGIGLNYRRHAEETGMAIPERPIVFFKPPSSVIGDGDTIRLPSSSHKVDYECELAVVIGRAAKNVSKTDALGYVVGYTGANDVSARDWQQEWGGSQWSRGKSFDTFCPLGPVLVTLDEIPNPNALAIKTVLSGETRQDWNTGDMIFDVPTLIEFLSHETTLWPGTVILTGTPQGVGMAAKPQRFLRDGDDVTIEIEGIGALRNNVQNAA